MASLFRRFYGLLSLVLLLSACTPSSLYHPRTAKIEDCLPDADPKAENCQRAAVERIKISSPDNSYSQVAEVAYVEFSDQGWLQKREQMERALQLLDNPAFPKKRVVVYIHGWHHSAAPGDDDVKNFKQVILPSMMDPHHQTIGIYAAWRGQSIDAPGLEQATFYDRKASAEHVARGSVRELISRLRAQHNAVNAVKKKKDIQKDDEPLFDNDKDLQIILIGHSFGGLILYNALAGSLLDAIVDANHVKNSRRLVRPLADLAIVINPAFEASRFEPLFQAAKQRLEKLEGASAYSIEQFPVFVSITSESDWATKYAFPIGRTVNSVFEHEGMVDEDCPPGPARQELNESQCFAKKLYGERLEKVSNTNTMGHLSRYRSHELTLDVANKKVLCAEQIQDPNLMGNVAHFPLWNMYAKGKNVIDGHSGIYDPPLWNFIASLANANAKASRETRDGKSVEICTSNNYGDRHAPAN